MHIINKNILDRFIVGKLRILTLFSKLLLVYLIAATIELEDAGRFALYTTLVLSVSTLAGFDTYAQAIRLISEKSSIGSKLLVSEDHMRSIGLISAIVFIIGLIVVVSVGVRHEYFWIMVIAVCHSSVELFSQEYSRLLPSLNLQKLSAHLLFLRSGLWVIVAFVLIKLNFVILSNIEVIVVSWFSFSLLTIVITVFVLCPEWTKKDELSTRKRVRKIYKSVKDNLVLFCSSLSFRALLSFDKYIVLSFIGLKGLGLYSIYVSIGMALVSVMEAAVGVWKYPKVIEYVRSKNYRYAREYLKKYFLENMFLSGVAVCLMCFIVPMFLVAIGKPEHATNIASIYIVLFGVFLFICTTPFHYVVFASGKDSYLLASNVSGVFALFVFSVVVWFQRNIEFASIMFAFSMFILSLSRLYFFSRVVSKW